MTDRLTRADLEAQVAAYRAKALQEHDLVRRSRAGSDAAGGAAVNWKERLSIILRREQEHPHPGGPRLTEEQYREWEKWHRQAYPERYELDGNGYDVGLGYGFLQDPDCIDREAP